MLNPEMLKTVVKVTKIWPGRAANSVEMVGSDNKIYTTDVCKEEVELALYLKNNVFPKLPQEARTKLLMLIEEYGSMKYYDSELNNAESEAGADL